MSLSNGSDQFANGSPEDVAPVLFGWRDKMNNQPFSGFYETGHELWQRNYEAGRFLATYAQCLLGLHNPYLSFEEIDQVKQEIKKILAIQRLTKLLGHNYFLPLHTPPSLFSPSELTTPIQQRFFS